MLIVTLSVTLVIFRNSLDDCGIWKFVVTAMVIFLSSTAIDGTS